MKRNQKILAMVGKKSYSLIARDLGTTRNVVAGVVWRSQWPKEKRIGNKCGRGRHGPGPTAAIALPRYRDRQGRYCSEQATA